MRPLIRQPPDGMRSTRVCTFAASEPIPGSLNAKQQIARPSRMAGRYFSRKPALPAPASTDAARLLTLSMPRNDGQVLATSAISVP